MESVQYTKCRVSGTLSLILFISFLTGIAPLKFRKMQNGWEIRTSNAANVYGRLVVLSSSILSSVDIASGVLEIWKLQNHLPFKAVMISITTQALAQSLALVATFSAMERMRHVINNLAKLKTINTQLNEINNCKQFVPKNWKMFMLVIFLLFLGYFTILFGYGIFIHEVAFDKQQVSIEVLHLVFFMMLHYPQVTSIQFLLITSTVFLSFKLFNTSLKLLHKKILEENEINNQRNNKTLITVRRLGLLYCSLCEVVQSLNAAYGLLLAYQLLVCLLYLIITLFYIFHRLYLHKCDITLSSAIYTPNMQFLWLCYHLSNLIIIIEPCHWTHKEMQKTKFLVSKLMQYTHPLKHDINSELLLFYRFLKLYEFEYSPLKLCTLNRSLLTKIMGSAATYLVIVLTL